MPFPKLEVLHDPERPGLLVLHRNVTFGKGFHSDSITWIDPARDDLPVESLSRSNFGASEPTAQVAIVHTVVLDFGRLKDGRWYPTHWQTGVVHPARPGIVDDGSEVWLQFFP